MYKYQLLNFRGDEYEKANTKWEMADEKYQGRRMD